MQLDTSVQYVKGVGEKVAALLARLGIATVEDLIYHFPRRYDDYSQILNIKDIEPGPVTLRVRVESVHARYARRGLHITEALVKDATGQLKIVWFNQPYRADALNKNKDYFLSGEFAFQGEKYSIVNPSMELVSAFPKNTARIVPIYPETKGLKSHQIRKFIGELVPLIKDLPESLPDFVVKNDKLMSRADALGNLHFPAANEALESAQERLGFEELYEVTLASLLNKQAAETEAGTPIKFDEQLAKDFVASLPYRLTDAQRKAAWDTVQDLARHQPMNRLIEGDVGSGKTIVAAMAILQTAKAGHQTAYMAPTEILARQQFDELTKLLKPFGVKTALFIGALNEKRKMEIGKSIESGSTDLIVGTHALIEKHPVFKNLTLAIIDEQHRFGVNQRKALMQKANSPGSSRADAGRGSQEERVNRMDDTASEGRTPADTAMRRESAAQLAPPDGRPTAQETRVPHVLTLTATPIPRSLALTVFGELDISVINQLPPGRKSIITQVASPASRAQLYSAIEAQLKQGRQGYVICPLVDESDTLGVKSVNEEFKRLSDGPFKHRKIGLLHGQLKSAEKDKVMKRFAGGEFDLLVATTVVEVGVNVPNATVILIEGAERFGLAQLHQLRGRVRRGSHQPYCYLMPSTSDVPLKRLRAVAATDDGFKLAEMDLQMRGPGEIYGARQHGSLDLRLAKLSDAALIARARTAAAETVNRKVDLLQYPRLSARIDNLRKITNLN